MTITGGAPAVSLSRSRRPSRSCTPAASRYPALSVLSRGRSGSCDTRVQRASGRDERPDGVLNTDQDAGVRKTGRFHSRHPSHFIEHRFNRLGLSRDRIFTRQDELKREDAIGVVALLHRGELHEARGQETRADEENRRHRHLADNERHPQARVTPRRSRTARVNRQATRAGQVQRRQDAKHHRRRAGQGERNREQSNVDADLVGARQDVGAEDDAEDALSLNRGELLHQRDAQCAQRGANDAAGSRQNEALRQHLAHEPAAAGPERGTRRELAPPPRAAREEQTGHVGADDRQDQGHRAEEDAERWLQVRDDVVLQVLRLEARPRERRRGRRPRRADGRADPVGFLRRGEHRHAVTQTADQRREPDRPAAGRLTIGA